MSDSATATFGLAQMGQIAVPVSDMDRVIAFHRDTLEMRFLFRAPPGLGFFRLRGCPAGVGCSRESHALRTDFALEVVRSRELV